MRRWFAHTCPVTGTIQQPKSSLPSPANRFDALRYIFNEKVGKDNVHNSLKRFCDPSLVGNFKAHNRVEEECIGERFFHPFSRHSGYPLAFLCNSSVLHCCCTDTAECTCSFLLCESLLMEVCSWSGECFLELVLTLDFSALCKNASFITKDAWKVATVTVTAAAVMLNPICLRDERKTDLKWLKCSPHTLPQTSIKQKPRPSRELENTHGSVCYSRQLTACDSIWLLWDAIFLHGLRRRDGLFYKTSADRFLPSLKQRGCCWRGCCFMSLMAEFRSFYGLRLNFLTSSGLLEFNIHPINCCCFIHRSLNTAWSYGP